MRSSAEAEVRGAAAVAGTFSGRARAAQPALVNGVPGAVWAPGGQPRVAFDFPISGGKIVKIEMLGDPERLASWTWRSSASDPLECGHLPQQTTVVERGPETVPLDRCQDAVRRVHEDSELNPEESKPEVDK